MCVHTYTHTHTYIYIYIFFFSFFFFFNNVPGVLQGYTLASRLFIICLDYLLRTLINLIKRNGFTLKKTRIRQYPTVTDIDYANDLELLSNTPAQTKFLLHSLEQAPGDIDLYMNANKTEFKVLKRRSYIHCKW